MKKHLSSYIFVTILLIAGIFTINHLSTHQGGYSIFSKNFYKSFAENISSGKEICHRRPIGTLKWDTSEKKVIGASIGDEFVSGTIECDGKDIMFVTSSRSEKYLIDGIFVYEEF